MLCRLYEAEMVTVWPVYPSDCANETSALSRSPSPSGIPSVAIILNESVLRFIARVRIDVEVVAVAIVCEPYSFTTGLDPNML